MARVVVFAPADTAPIIAVICPGVIAIVITSVLSMAAIFATTPATSLVILAIASTVVTGAIVDAILGMRDGRRDPQYGASRQSNGIGLRGEESPQ